MNAAVNLKWKSPWLDPGLDDRPSSGSPFPIRYQSSPATRTARSSSSAPRQDALGHIRKADRTRPGSDPHSQAPSAPSSNAEKTRSPLNRRCSRSHGKKIALPLQPLAGRLVPQPPRLVGRGHLRLLAHALRPDHDRGQVEVDVRKGGEQLRVEASRALVPLPALASRDTSYTQSSVSVEIRPGRSRLSSAIEWVFQSSRISSYSPSTSRRSSSRTASLPRNSAHPFALHSRQYCSICVVGAAWTGRGRAFTARTIQSSPTSSTLMQPAPARRRPGTRAAGERPGEEGAVDSAVQDGEAVSQSPSSSRSSAGSTRSHLADRLAAQEAVVGHARSARVKASSSSSSGTSPSCPPRISRSSGHCSRGAARRCVPSRPCAASRLQPRGRRQPPRAPRGRIRLPPAELR